MKPASGPSERKRPTAIAPPDGVPATSLSAKGGVSPRSPPHCCANGAYGEAYTEPCSGAAASSDVCIVHTMPLVAVVDGAGAGGGGVTGGRPDRPAARAAR